VESPDASTSDPGASASDPGASASDPCRPFDGRTALVTGAGSGIGAVIATRLARAGAAVALLGRDTPALEAVRAGILAAGGTAEVTPGDVRDGQALAGAVARCEDSLGPVDILVHSAAWARGQVFLCDQTEQGWLDTVDTNLNGAFRICRLVVPGMMERRRGGIVLVSSIAGKRGLPANTAYCASKAGLNGLTQALAAELGPFDVRVNAVCPGLTRSPGTTDPERYGSDFMASLGRHHGPPDLDWDRYVRSAVRGTALRRLVEPDEVADLTLFLLSPASGGITGQAMSVDAGAL
jgi:NAD(P)-dependent dehydrogenase (short-subunit alcohol dehydrogenase family)